MIFNEIHIKHCPHDSEFVDLWELVLLALKTRNMDLFFQTNFRFSCLLVRDPYSMTLNAFFYCRHIQLSTRYVLLFW